MSKRKFQGYTVIQHGVDARGQWFVLVHDPDTGGSKYIWEKGHVWAGFAGSQCD